jgi:hypothetical protein
LRRAVSEDAIMPSDNVRVTIRLPRPLLNRIDTHAGAQAREFGVPVPREAAIRALLTSE